MEPSNAYSQRFVQNEATYRAGTSLSMASGRKRSESTEITTAREILAATNGGYLLGNPFGLMGTWVFILGKDMNGVLRIEALGMGIK